MFKTQLVCLMAGVALTVAVTAPQALGKNPRETFVAATRVGSPAGPFFRDPKTGRVWTLEDVSEDGKPTAPEDRAFDPGGQVIVAGRPVLQYPRVRHVADVPITAGPTGPAVPIVEIDADSLRVKAGQGWRMLLYLQNNSRQTLSSIVDCEFRNGDRLAEKASAIIVEVGAGERVAFFVYGPPGEVFVDSAACRVTEP